MIYSPNTGKKLKANGGTVTNVYRCFYYIQKEAKLKTWMLKLRTIYIYDLDNCLGNEYKKDYTHVFMSNKITPIKQNKFSDKKTHKNNNTFSLDEFL